MIWCSSSINCPKTYFDGRWIRDIRHKQHVQDCYVNEERTQKVKILPQKWNSLNCETKRRLWRWTRRRRWRGRSRRPSSRSSRCCDRRSTRTRDGTVPHKQKSVNICSDRAVCSKVEFFAFCSKPRPGLPGRRFYHQIWAKLDKTDQLFFHFK